MTALADLIPDAKALSAGDKLRLIRLLADDLTADDGLVPAGQADPVWSPDHAGGVSSDHASADMTAARPPRIYSPRLVRPDAAGDFVKQVLEVTPDVAV